MVFGVKGIGNVVVLTARGMRDMRDASVRLALKKTREHVIQGVGDCMINDFRNNPIKYFVDISSGICGAIFFLTSLAPIFKFAESDLFGRVLSDLGEGLIDSNGRVTGKALCCMIFVFYGSVALFLLFIIDSCFAMGIKYEAEFFIRKIISYILRLPPRELTQTQFLVERGSRTGDCIVCFDDFGPVRVIVLPPAPCLHAIHRDVLRVGNKIRVEWNVCLNVGRI